MFICKEYNENLCLIAQSYEGQFFPAYFICTLLTLYLYEEISLQVNFYVHFRVVKALYQAGGA